MKPRGLGARLASPHRLLLATALMMVGIGLVMILSASSVEAYRLHGSSFYFFKRQAMGALVGAAAMLALARIDYR
ncbi:MAG: FtsW/RodA/SpoVE family cell cycle protein, partial [Acidimicrobiales bacterium]